MRYLILLLVSIFSLQAADGRFAGSTSRRIACKMSANAQSCYWTHGRFSYYNGTPAYRLWKIGTHRLLGIYSGPSVDRRSLDNENPELPANLRRVFDPPNNRIFGDFEVCPLEAERPGSIQAACIEAAKDIVAEQ